jgi:hypothetical protein
MVFRKNIPMNLYYVVPIVTVLLVAGLWSSARHKRRVRKASLMIIHHVTALDTLAGCSRPDVHLQAILDAAERYGVKLGSSKEIPHWETLMLKAAGALMRYSETQLDIMCAEVQSASLAPEHKSSLEKLWRVLEAQAHAINDYARDDSRSTGIRTRDYDIKFERQILGVS